MGVFKDLQTDIEEYCRHLTAQHQARFPTLYREYEYEVGSKYVHIISRDTNQRFSHSFVVVKPDNKFAFGDILKSAGWKKPATNFKRGSVLSEEQYKHISWAGI